MTNTKLSAGNIIAYIAAVVLHILGIIGLVVFNGLAVMTTDGCSPHNTSCINEYNTYIALHLILLVASYLVLIYIFRRVTSHYVRALTLALLPVINAIIYVMQDIM